MKIDDKIRGEEVQYDINGEAAKISALSSGKMKKYEFLTGEKILSSDQSRIIEEAKFTYSPLGKAFQKQIKTIEEHGKKHTDAIANQKKRLEALINKDGDHKDEEIFNELVNERFNKVIELTDKISR